MKKIFFGVAMAVAATSAAQAADLAPRVYTKAPPPVVAYNWTGCYVGGNIGGKSASTRDDVLLPATAFTATTTDGFGRGDSSTFIGGGQVGCNWQQPGSNWVFGIEGDADGQRWRRTMVSPATTIPPFVPGDVFALRSDWQASIRGRLGYAWDRWMVYGTGGVAFTEVRADANFIAVAPFPQVLASSRRTLIGATAGLGLEYAFGNNWSAGLEGRYTWYGRETFGAGSVPVFLTGGAAPVFVNAPATQTVRVDTVEVTARLNYKFNWAGPVTARY